MRILNIRFKNLNSLVGEWAIDLEDPAYVGDGIFAITGPTGAGKSTILDAICLALYGRTPRLGKVTKSTNEIMSRQTGECFAEVVFETSLGRYRCHWSQHRARRKAEGELQVPKHEIADALTGTLLETRLLDVARRIEQSTGMDFERFTRSMLLAQGGFAAFLQAPADDRAPILEQITGTEIYSRISIQVHQRRSAERATLDNLQAELKGIQLLEVEERQNLEQELSDLNARDLNWQAQLTVDRHALDWLRLIGQLQQNLESLIERKAALQAQQAAFAPEATRLRLAQQALELEGDYALLSQTRTLQESEGQQLKQLEADEPLLVRAVETADHDCRAAIQERDRLRQTQSSRAHDIRQARALDLTLRERLAARDGASTSANALAEELRGLLAEQTGLESTLQVDSAKLRDLRLAVQDRSGDSALVESLAGIEANNAQFQQLLADERQRRVEWQAAGDRHRVELAKQHDNAENQAVARHRLHESQQSLEQIQQQRDRDLAGTSLQEWRTRLTALQRRQQRVTQALSAAQALQAARQRQGELAQQHETLATREAGLSKALQDGLVRQKALEGEQALRETQLRMAERINSLEEARHQLQDGQPCPLCGAVEHPYATDVLPQPDEVGAQLQQTRQHLKQVENTIRQAQVQQAGCHRDQAHLATALQTCSDDIAGARSALQALEDVCPVDIDAPDLPSALDALLQQSAVVCLETEARVQAAEQTDQQWQEQQTVLARSREQLYQAEQLASELAHNVQVAAGAVVSGQQQLDDIQRRQTALLAQLQQAVAPFDAGLLDRDNRQAVLQTLTQRRDQWLQWQQSLAELDSRVTQMQQRLQWLATDVEKTERNGLAQRNALDSLTGQLKQLRQDRQTLLGDLDPDAEEARLAGLVSACEQRLDTVKTTLAAAQQGLNAQQSRKKQLVDAQAERGQSLSALDDRFHKRLVKAGFSDEMQFQQARLSEDERQELERRAQALAADEVALQQDTQRWTQQLAAEQAKALTDQSQEALEARVQTQTGQLHQLQQQIGGIRQRLRADEALRETQQARLQMIEVQVQDCTRWDQLHALIGSSDGKKYRNFAQGLTFDMMIGHANRQLQKMTDRYLLLRDPQQPLELNVIDSFQAGEVRSTKNLSGGESFLVSLALALGLSHMASRNVRVDSLFLDEGFGTLDEEALDTALETLSGLQQEGKLIGVISHVASLRERISTQLQVTPQTGGRSRIEGPGVRYLS